MDIKAALINEIKHEGASTRRMLERIPTDKSKLEATRQVARVDEYCQTRGKYLHWVPRAINNSEYDMAKTLCPQRLILKLPRSCYRFG